MPSRQSNSLLAMLPDKYRDFVGVEYEAPHGCFRLVAKVFLEAYGIDLGDQDGDLLQAQSKDRTARMQECLRRMTHEVKNPQEGDVIIIRGRPWHMGLVVYPPYMIHSYNGGTACIENYTDMRWRNRIQGFFRYCK